MLSRHNFRRTFSTWLEDAGIPAPYVAALTALILTHSKRPILGASVFTAGPLVLDAVLAAVVLTASRRPAPAGAAQQLRAGAGLRGGRR
jgi:hypothetical protein